MADSELTSRPTVVYKILLQSQWTSWGSLPKTEIPGSRHTAQVFTGAGIDIQDGYIHLSTIEQCAGTYSKWFAASNPAESEASSEADQAGEPLVVVEVDLKKVIGRVEWEAVKSRGEHFAHVYDGGIPYVRAGQDGDEVSAVSRTWEGNEVRTSLFEKIKNNQ